MSWCLCTLLGVPGTNSSSTGEADFVSPERALRRMVLSVRIEYRSASSPASRGKMSLDKGNLTDSAGDNEGDADEEGGGGDVDEDIVGDVHGSRFDEQHE